MLHVPYNPRLLQHPSRALSPASLPCRLHLLCVGVEARGGAASSRQGRGKRGVLQLQRTKRPVVTLAGGRKIWVRGGTPAEAQLQALRKSCGAV